MMEIRFADNVRVIDLVDEETVPRNVSIVDYIRQQVEHILKEDEGNSYCALVIIDHCEVIIERLNTLRARHEQRYEIVERLPLAIRDRLAGKLKCPVWAVHQLNGEANNAKPNAGSTHGQAKGSRSWGTYFRVCFSISQVNLENYTCRLQITKNRGGARTPDKTLKLDGAIGTLTEVDAEPERQERKPEKKIPLKDQVKTVKRPAKINA